MHLSVAAASSGLSWLDCRNIQNPVASLKSSAPARRCRTVGQVVLAALEDGKVNNFCMSDLAGYIWQKHMCSFIPIYAWYALTARLSSSFWLHWTLMKQSCAGCSITYRLSLYSYNPRHGGSHCICGSAPSPSMICSQVRLWQPTSQNTDCTMVDRLQVAGCPASMAAELLATTSNSNSQHSFYLAVGTDAGQSGAWHSGT